MTAPVFDSTGRSNAAPGDASPVECRRTFTTGCQGALTHFKRRRDLDGDRSSDPLPRSEPHLCPSPFLRRRSGVAARRLPAEFLQAPSELLIELGAFAGVPVAPMTRFTRLVEILADVPQLVDVFSLDDVERFERHISERLDSCVPLHRITFDLRADLRLRQFDRVRSRAVVLVSGRSERSTDFEQIRAFCKRDRTDADFVPVLFGL